MADQLLPYFNRELTAIRRLAGEFAEAHPKIAGRLRLSPDAVDDPHVARLLDGVAFLSARAQARLDDEFPELTDTLLNVLYPHFLAPFPSCAIAQFTPKPDLQAMVEVAAGFTLDTEAVRGQTCRFRTAGPVTLWPVKIESARLLGLPFTAPANPMAAGAVAALRLVVSTMSSEAKFSEIGLDKMRLFIRGGQATALPLFEALAGHTVSVALADSPGDPSPIILPKTVISAAGFAPEEALLPWPARSFSGFRLLSEYFAFPQKFMFLDLSGLDAKTLLCDANRFEIYVYLSRSSNELERAVAAENFALGCVPIVNLFPQRCEPIAMDHTTTEYRILPDARRSGVMEVWRVNGVREVRQDSTSRPWRPFYRLSHAADAGAFYGVEGVDNGAVRGLAVAMDVHGHVGIGLAAIGEGGEHVRKGDGLLLQPPLPVLPDGQIDDVRFDVGRGLGGGGQTGFERAHLLHLEADHHERGQQEEHNVNQRDDLQPDAFAGDGRADFHGAVGTGSAGCPPTMKPTFCTPALRTASKTSTIAPCRVSWSPLM